MNKLPSDAQAYLTVARGTFTAGQARCTIRQVRTRRNTGRATRLRHQRFITNMSEPIVFIHGLLNVLGHLGVAGFFAPRAVIIPDLLGYGGCPAPVERVSLSSQVEFLLREMDQARIGSAHLVGHSMGGAVAVLLARAAPDRVAGIVNVEGNYTLKDAFWSSKIAAMTVEEVSEMLDRDRRDVQTWLVRNAIQPTRDRIAWATAMFAGAPAGTVWAMSQSIVDVTAHPDYLQGVKEVLDAGIPMHLLAGERSRAAWDVPPFVLSRAKSFQTHPGTGHLMMLEEPRSFLRLVSQVL